MGRKKKRYSSIGKKVRRNLTLTLVQNFVHKVVIFYPNLAPNLDTLLYLG